MNNKKFKFDVVIGNPPFQDESRGNSTSKPPIYNDFIDASQKVGKIVELIHPARFLFNAGDTPKNWNKKMLSNKHLKVFYYEANASKVFPGVPLTGGVAVTYFNSNLIIGPIGKFVPFDELRNIIKKVKISDFISIKSIITVQSKFDLKKLYFDYPQYKQVIGSDGKDRRVRANAFTKINVFSDKKTHNSYRILGLLKDKRTYKYVNKKYILKTSWIDKYKVFVPESNGASGMLSKNSSARIISKPVIGLPNDGVTQTFIVIGSLETYEEAKALYKYILTKFVRALLGSLKVTQRNNANTWENVPLQNFTPHSDINWTKSISEIDQQLYKKYDLNEEEINFIEAKVKEMD